ncbi:MAG TPA: nitrogenase-stabilizing/protective protein NifW [Burkholderiales bacterium]|nr:nitrogenase-stabilizing/protective protein NifW [Burkholderiales bacterium]
MDALTSELSRLSSAEEFFAYFGLDYDPRVLSVNRLHILKRFSQYLEAGSRWRELPEADARAACRELLDRAYREFEVSSGVERGLFKVFEQARGVQKVPLSRIRRALPAGT